MDDNEANDDEEMVVTMRVCCWHSTAGEETKTSKEVQ
jgi:hypothetical protein